MNDINSQILNKIRKNKCNQETDSLISGAQIKPHHMYKTIKVASFKPHLIIFN